VSVGRIGNGNDLKVFISYGHPADQITALRLQALGAVNGLTIFVPPVFTRSFNGMFDSDSGQKLLEADVVLGVVGEGLTDGCRQELNIGLANHKKMIVMASPVFAQQLHGVFGANLVVMDPTNPIAAETGIMAHLKELGLDSNQSAAKALLALGILTLGLVFLSRAADGD
jgi:hypothetical protein